MGGREGENGCLGVVGVWSPVCRTLIVVEYGLRFAGVLSFFHKIDENGKVIRVEADRRKPGGCEGQMAADKGEVRGWGSDIWQQPGWGVLIKEAEGAADSLLSMASAMFTPLAKAQSSRDTENQAGWWLKIRLAWWTGTGYFTLIKQKNSFFFTKEKIFLVI